MVEEQPPGPPQTAPPREEKREVIDHPKLEGKPTLGFRITVAYGERILGELDRLRATPDLVKQYPELDSIWVAFDTQLRKWPRCKECNAPLKPNGEHA